MGKHSTSKQKFLSGVGKNENCAQKAVAKNSSNPEGR